MKILINRLVKNELGDIENKPTEVYLENISCLYMNSNKEVFIYFKNSRYIRVGLSLNQVKQSLEL